MLRLKKFKRAFTVMLLSVTCFSTIFGELASIPAYADPSQGTAIQTARNDLNKNKISNNSNDLRSMFIQFAQGKDFNSMQKVEDLTASDLQILGTFISNFYAPWETRVDQMDENSATMSAMQDALTKYCGFQKDIARGIIKACWSVSMHAKPLKVAKYDVDTHAIGSIETRNTGEECYYDEMLYYMRGGSPGDTSDYCLYWGDEGSPKIAMESFNKNSSKGAKGNISASATAFLWATAGIDWEKGWGDSVTTKTTRKEVEDLVPTTEKKGFIANWGMKIDSFGNILCDTDKGRYVVLPACMNAYTWTSPDKSQAGQAIPMVNFCGLSATDFKNKPKNQYFRLYAHQKEDEKPIVYDWGMNSGLVAQTHWYPIRYSEKPDDNDLDFSQWHWSNIFTGAGEKSDGSSGHNVNDNVIAKLCRANKLLTDTESHSDSDWYIPNWGQIFGSIQKGGGVAQYKYIDDFVMLDNMGAFQSNDSSKQTFQLNPTGIFDSSEDRMYWVDGEGPKDNYGGDTKMSLKAYKAAGCPNGYEKIEWYYAPFEDVHDKIASGDNSYVLNNGKIGADGTNKYVLGIYLSYLLAYTGDPMMHYTFNKSGLPEIKEDSLVYADMTPVPDDGQRLKELQNMVYYLLNPKEGIRYVKQLFKTKVTAILVGIHESVVGAGNKANLGVKKYIGFSGYVTTPELKDLSWTAQILDRYTSIFIYLVMGIIVILLGYVMIGSMSLQKALLGAVTFALCAYFPPYIIDGTISVSNQYADSIYGSKFMYWALVESQVYTSEIESSATSGNYSDYMVTLFKQTNNWNDDNTATVAITLKWMCPKKNNYMYTIQKQIDQHDSVSSKLLNNLLRKTYSEESYNQSGKATFLYRSYNDISNYSKYLYRHLDQYGVNAVDTTTEKKVGITVSSIKADGSKASDSGFTVLDPNKNSNYRWLPLYTSEYLGKAFSEDVTQATQEHHFGLEQKQIDYTLADINGATGKLANSGLFSYEQISESPFYFFSWNFYDQGMSSKPTSTGGFKDLMLGAKTGGIDTYFYNTKLKGAGGGEVRDYLDMRNLFTAVIPVLKESNKMVKTWDRAYGMRTYEGVSCVPNEVYTGAGDPTEWNYKHWHNVNVAQLWNMYTPWVDTMYDCSYAKPEKISVAGKSKIVEDPLNPESYFPNEGRPMIFSKSEMTYYGLNVSDLTQVEKKILDVENATMQDLYNLTNYYTFNDTALNSASSMVATFNFNKSFSQATFLSESLTLFPQNFELKNFSYDAYLRLIMANATGESLSGTDNLYQTIVENSGIITGILMILNDILVCYCISGLKLFFLLGIFLASLVVIISATIRLEIQLGKTIWESIVSPLVKFLLVSVAHAWIISCFMSVGAANITGNKDMSISLGDPAMTFVFLLVIHIVVVILYFKIVKGTVRDVIKYTKAVGNSIGGMIGGVMSGATGLMSAGKAFATGGLIGGAVASRLASSNMNRFRGRSNKVNQAQPNDLRGIKTNKKGGLSKSDINDRINEGKDNLNKTTGKGDTESTSRGRFGTKNVHASSERTEIADGKNAVISNKKNKKLGGLYSSSKQYDGIAPIHADGKHKGKIDRANAEMKKTGQKRKFSLGRLGRFESDKDYTTGKETVRKKILFGREKTITRDLNSSKFGKAKHNAKKKVKSKVKQAKKGFKLKASKGISQAKRGFKNIRRK